MQCIIIEKHSNQINTILKTKYLVLSHQGKVKSQAQSVHAQTRQSHSCSQTQNMDIH